jgi:CheY-like chemotaxis protein
VSKRKLLLADDSITIQKVVNLTFADEGIEVISVGDGDSAMQKFDEFMPDLVMADVNMPGLTGYEICQIIKQNDDTRRIPVILLVGSFEPFDETEAARVGADDFLTKPFQSIRQLVNKVNDLLNRNEIVVEESPAVEAAVAPPVDTFADTLEFDKKEEAPTEFGDAGMDDEMIETSPANEFTTAASFETPAETTIDYAKTQPLSADDLKGFSIVPPTGEVEPAPQENAEEQEIAGENFEDESPAFEINREETVVEAPFNEESVSSEYFAPETESEKTSEPTLQYYAPVEEEPAGLPEVELAEPEAAEQSTFEPETPESRTTEFIGEAEPADFGGVETTAEIESEAAETPSIDESENRYQEETEESVSEESVSEESQTPESETEEAETEEEKTNADDWAEKTETEEPEAAETDLKETAEIPVSEPEQVQAEPPAAATENAPALGFDDDLLELPPLVEETGIRPQPDVQQFVSEPAEPAPAAETETVSETAPEAPAETETAQAETLVTAESSMPFMQSFPPELIEAIAQRVAEKISAQTMNDVLPQITELVIKKMAEEKLKGS